MKKAAIAILAFASAASMVGIANAIPFGANNLPPGLSNEGGPPGLNNQGGSPPGLTNQGALPPGLSAGGNNPLISLNAPVSPVSTVPEGGASVLMLGIGLLALAFLKRRWQANLG